MTTPASGEEKRIRAEFPALSDENSQESSTDPCKEFAQGLPDNRDTDFELRFTDWRMKVYEDKSHTWKSDSDLLEEYWKDEFELFNLKMLRALPKDLRRSQRDHLRAHGVYVPVGKGIIILEALHRELTKELIWPRNDKKGPITGIDPEEEEDEDEYEETREVEVKTQHAKHETVGTPSVTPVPPVLPGPLTASNK